MDVTLALCDEEVVMRWCVYIGTLSPAPLSISHPSNAASICLSTAAAVMALLLGYGLVTILEMLLQPPGSITQSPQHFSRRLPNALSKCSHPEHKLNSQGPQTVMILSPFAGFFFHQSISICPFVVCHDYTAETEIMDARLSPVL